MSDKVKEISFDELKQRVRKNGPVVGLKGLKIDGIVEIRDKDGKLKSKMRIFDLK